VLAEYFRVGDKGEKKRRETETRPRSAREVNNKALTEAPRPMKYRAQPVLIRKRVKVVECCDGVGVAASWELTRDDEGVVKESPLPEAVE
jgi:hypothetical protein